MKTMLSTIAFGAALVAVPAFAQVMASAEYVAAAGASDLYEITSSKLVMTTTKNPKVRDFAQIMVDHHTKSTADVNAAAAKAKVNAPPPKLMPLQREQTARLKAETATSRDAACIAQQKASHDQALNLQKAYAMDGTAAPLKAAASNIVPAVEQHIAMLKTM